MPNIHKQLMSVVIRAGNILLPVARLVFVHRHLQAIFTLTNPRLTEPRCRFVV